MSFEKVTEENKENAEEKRRKSGGKVEGRVVIDGGNKGGKGETAVKEDEK